MVLDTKELEKKLKEAEEKVLELEELVKSLKSDIGNKEIIIDALIAKLKNGGEEKRKSKGSEESPKRFKECLPGIEESISEITMTNSEAEKSDKGLKRSQLTETAELISQVKEIFVSKTSKIDFKLNYSFRKFIEYAESSYEFSLFNKKVVKTKNPLKQFLEMNLSRITKFIIENINSLNMNQICSAIFLINSEMAYKEKLVFFHDLILELKNCSKLLYIASALFNNLDLEYDLFSQVIKKILYHQLCIDGDLYKGTELINYLNIIRENLALSSPDVTLWDTPTHFLVKHKLFDDGTKKIKSDAIERGFIVRMLCHYLDWDYTYNNFIHEQIYPLIMKDKSPIHVYYIGILMMNAKRLFGDDLSIQRLENVLREILEWNDECSVAAYLILKQVAEIDADEWLLKNLDVVEKLGFKIEYLKKFLLI